MSGNWKKLIASGSQAELTSITASIGFSGSNLNPLLSFDGNRPISNADFLGTVYEKNFGIEGNLTDFIEAVFFTNKAPELSPSTQVFELNDLTSAGHTVGTITATDDESNPFTFSIGSESQFESLTSNFTDNFFSVSTGGVITLLITANSSTFNSTTTPTGVDAYPLPVIITDTFGSTSTGVVYIAVTANRKPEFSCSINGSTFQGVTTQNSDGDFIFSASLDLNENSSAGLKGNKFTVIVNEPDGQSFLTDQPAFTGITVNGISNSTLFEWEKTVNSTSQVQFELNQLTSSLDFDNDGDDYDNTFTAADQHASDASDTVKLLFHFEVSDNKPPTINPSSFNVNENSGDNQFVGSIVTAGISDQDNDTSTTWIFTNFSLSAIHLGGTNQPNIIADFSDTNNDHFNPNRNPFTVNTTLGGGGSSFGQVTKIPGTFLNSDIADTYVYNVTISDVYNLNPNGANFEENSATVTITILDDSEPTITLNNDPGYLIESAVDGDFIRQNANGRSGAQTNVDSSGEMMRWEVNSVPDIDIASFTVSGFRFGATNATQGTGSRIYFQLDSNLSGSANDLTFADSDTVKIEITGSKHSFPSTKIFRELTCNIAINNAPTIGNFLANSVLNTNEALDGVTLGTHTLSDTESDTIESNVVTINNSDLTATNTSGQVQIKANGNLTAGDYPYTITMYDEHNFRQFTKTHTITITQANPGTFTGGTSFYVIDTALSGDPIYTATGFSGGSSNGSQGDLGVNYTYSEGNPSVQSFEVNNSDIAITNPGGLLTINTQVSGTASPNAGDVITCGITSSDQYNNKQYHDITVTVFANDAPNIINYSEASITTEDTTATGVTLATFGITDNEFDRPYSASVTGTDADKIELVSTDSPNNTTYAIRNIVPITPNTANPGQGKSLDFTLQAMDSHGLTGTLTETITIPDAAPQIYAYTYDNQDESSAEFLALALLGREIDENGDPTGVITSGSVLGHFISGSLGDVSFTTLADTSGNNNKAIAATCTRRRNVQFSDLKSTNSSNGLRQLDSIDLGTHGQARSMFLFPSASTVSNKPSEAVAIQAGKGNYVGYIKDKVTNQEYEGTYYCKYFDLKPGVIINGYSRWGIMVNAGLLALNHYQYMVGDGEDFV